MQRLLIFIWYFNVPNEWSHWYICPVQQPFKPAFRDWLYADRLYQGFDQAGVLNRTRGLQALQRGYFVAGQEYIMWFSELKPHADDKVTFSMAFVPPQEDAWEHDDFEQALRLSPQAAKKQMVQLSSRGGEILLDGAFFDKKYAHNRIDDLFQSFRVTRRLAGGFYISMEIKVLMCGTKPLLSDIEAKYGLADFVQPHTELNQVYARTDNDPDVTTYFYDYFGFETVGSGDQRTVQRVVAHAVNYHDLKARTQDKGLSFARLPMRNLTVFYDAAKEVGRLYYFLEGSKETVCVQLPPKGSTAMKMKF